jgi:hypothetical protein
MKPDQTSLEAPKTVQVMLEELKAKDLTDIEIHRRTGIPQATVTRLRNGTHEDTNYQYGKRIEALHGEVCEKEGA